MSRSLGYCCWYDIDASLLLLLFLLPRRTAWMMIAWMMAVNSTAFVRMYARFVTVHLCPFSVCLLILRRQSMSAYFAFATASIWVSAAVCKVYYTKRVADLFEQKGYPPAESKPKEDVRGLSPADQAIAQMVYHVNLQESNAGEQSAHCMLSGSKSLCYATGGTFAAAFGFWLLAK